MDGGGMMNMLRSSVPGCVRICALWLVLITNAHAKTFNTGGYRFDIAPAPAWVDLASPEEQWAADVPGTTGAIWRNWLYDIQVDRRQGRRTVYHDYMYQPMTQTGLAEASKYQIGFLPDFQSLTIHLVEVRRDGRWTTRLKPEAITLARRETDFESDLSTGEVTALLVLDDLRVGDVVRVSYTVEGANPVLAGLDAEDLSFGGKNPLLRQRMRVIFDAGSNPLVQRDPRIPVERVETVAAGKLITIEQRNIKPISEDGSYPSWFVPLPRVVIAERHRWQDIATWARALYPAAKPLPEDLEALIREWSALPDQESRVVHALEAVQDQVRYFGVEIGENSHRPVEPADVWRKRAGDCKDKARLLATILGRLGIAAEPALVASRGGPWAARQLPSAAAFDHVIVRVHLGNRAIWLDPTRSQQRGSLEDHAVSNFGDALPVAADVNALVPVTQTSGALARWRVNERYQPDADGKSVRLQVTTEVGGTAAESMRNRLANTDREQLQSEYKNYYGKQFRNIRVAESMRVQDDPAANRIVITEAYLLADPWADFDAGIRGFDTEANTIETYVQLPAAMDNHYPIALSNPVDAEQRIELDLPPGWTWRGETLHKSIEVPGMSYSLTTGQKDSQVSFVHRYRSNAPYVEGDAISKLIEGERQVKDLVNRRFLVSRTGIAESREDRLSKLVKGILDDNGNTTSPDADRKN